MSATSLCHALLSALEAGPALSPDLARALNADRRAVSATLCYLHKCRRVMRSDHVSQHGRRAWMYAIREKQSSPILLAQHPVPIAAAHGAACEPPKVVYHLERAIAIQNAERDPRRWGSHLAGLPDAAREPCRAWLREEARKRQMFDRVQGAAARKHG